MDSITKIETEMSDVQERLARIEANQVHFGKQMDRLIGIQDKSLELVSHVDELKYNLTVVQRELKDTQVVLRSVKEEVSRWQTARKIFVWAIGISGALITTLIAFKNNGN